MPSSSSNLSFPGLKRVRQLNSFFCGPAVLEMLLSFHGVEIDQSLVVEKSGVALKIKQRGMTVEELALAAEKLVPDFQFWHKRHSTLKELSLLVNEFRIPVGVEWQGIFEFEDEAEDTEMDDEDPGHYSVVTRVNLADNLVYLADPYKSYAGKDRRLTVLEFERRWWDINETVDLKTRRRVQVDDYHMMFVVTRKEKNFPEQLKMSQG